MAINLGNINDEDELRKLSAGQASIPMYGSMQAQGASAIGDIFGINTLAMDEFGARQEEALGGFQSKYPERLLESANKVE